MSPLFHLFISKINLVFELGKAFIGTVVWDSDDGRVSSALLGFFPKLQTFQTLKLLKPDQNDKTGPEIQLTAAHTTSLTKELYLIFVAVEQASTFKPYKKFAASLLPLRSAKIPQLFAVFFADRKKHR